MYRLAGNTANKSTIIPQAAKDLVSGKHNSMPKTISAMPLI